MTDDLLARVRSRLADEDTAGVGPAALARLVRAEATLSGDSEIARAMGRVHAEVAGWGPLESVMSLPGVTDVVVNGPDQVWLDDGQGLRRTAVTFADDDEVRRLAQRLLAAAGRRVDLAQPCVDVQLAGVRVHVVGPPVADRTLLSLRVLRRRPFDIAELHAQGAVDERMREALASIVTARLNFLVTGATGAGKTTILGAMIGAIPPTERVVVVEDTAEITHRHPHVVHLRARGANAEGAGAITLSDLVRQALRMRPDRIVVGEARGAEVADLLAALNTGHAGSASTVHANTPQHVVARFEALGSLAGIAAVSIRSQLVAAVDVVVHVSRDGLGRRHVASVAMIRGDPHVVRVQTALSLAAAGAAAQEGAAWSAFAAATHR